MEEKRILKKNKKKDVRNDEQVPTLNVLKAI